MEVATSIKKEMRREPRSDFQIPVTFIADGKDSGIFGWTVDISPLGALVDCPTSAAACCPPNIAQRGNLWMTSHHHREEIVLSLGTARVVRRQQHGDLTRLAMEFMHPFEQEGVGPLFVGASRQARAIRTQIRRAAQCNYHVLITGETGAGKNVVAECIHRFACGTEAPFVRVHCPGIPESLFESELFGHEKGAFTDAKSATPGFFRIAGTGTILLDEISEVSVGMQAKLLHVLDEKAFIPVGGHSPVRIRCRILAASNADLTDRMHKGLFRQDLYYRLSETTITIPPLRERREDIPLLAEHFWKRHGAALEDKPHPIPPKRIEELIKRDWPGNVRELNNWVKQWLIGSDLSPGESSLTLNAPSTREALAASITEAIHAHTGSLQALRQRITEATERAMIDHALAESKGSHTGAARILGISYRTLLRRLTHHGLLP